MRFAPSEFWEMTIKEANLVIEGDKVRQENDFMVNYFAQRNAIASCIAKKFEFVNPFDKEKKKKANSKRTADELKSELDDMIKNWR